MLTRELGIPYEAVRAIYSANKDQLASTLRYERFITSETPDEWVRKLKKDVVSSGHPGVTYNIAADFLKVNDVHGMVTACEDKQLVLTAALVHDLGELRLDDQGCGDISFDQKNSQHEIEEAKIFQIVTENIPQSDRELIRKAYLEIVVDRTSRLGEMFNAIERIGYLKTAVRAYDGVAGLRIFNWRGLVGNVLQNQTDKLIKYSRRMPYVEQVLKESSNSIDAMFNSVYMSPPPQDRDGNPSYDQAKLELARLAWMDSLFAIR